MILFYLLTTIVAICNGQNAEIIYQENCFNVGGTLTIQAKYTGTGTPQSVVWSYSGVSGSVLTVVASTCGLFGSIPPGFPAGITFKCEATDSLPANTYQLIVSGLLSTESDKTWGVTFTPPVGIVPGAVQLAVPDLCTSCTCDCKCRCKKMVIASIVIGIVGAIILPIVVGGTVKEYFGRKTALVVVSIGIIFGVISSVLGIVVQAIDCCEDCCEDSDCCKCERNWIENTGAAFIAIGALVGIVGSVIFYRVWSGRIGPGNNAYKAKEAKDPGENHGMTGTSM